MEERLQKYLANCGVASRRKCEEYIIQGKVKVNGETITQLGIKINPEKDIVEFENKIVKEKSKKVYILLNKSKRPIWKRYGIRFSKSKRKNCSSRKIRHVYIRSFNIDR